MVPVGRGRGDSDKGHTHGGLSNNQRGQGKNKGECNLGKGGVYLSMEVSYIDDSAHCYPFLGKTESKASDVVILGSTLICHHMATILFDLDSI